jgi:hypothetical protein
MHERPSLLLDFPILALFENPSALCRANRTINHSEATSMTSISSRVRRSQTFLLALLASSAVFTAGCANMATSAVGGSSDAVTLGGTIHGGNQPVSGATVTLWFAGQGNPSPAVLAATTTSSTNGTGSFSFAAGSANGGTTGNTYTCPTAGSSPYVYVLATGGNTQGTGTHSNAASVFLAPYGPCNKLSASNFVDMTEVTTVATMAALQQYFVYSATSPIVGQAFNTGGSGLSYQSMGFAMNMVQNMVNLATGTAIPTTGLTINGSSGGQGSGGTSLVATPETAKINTIANILAACINIPDYPAGGNTACDTLFANAAPPANPNTTAQPAASYTAATNTLQAVYYMLSNPTNGSTTNLGALFALAPAAGAPFQPTLATAPSDWTIGISYASTSTCGASSGHLIHSVQDIAVDANGDIWLANNEAGGNLSVLATTTQASAGGTPTVVPAGCLQIGSGKNSGITIDAVTSGLANIWLADSGSSNVYRYQPTTAATAAVAFPTTAAPASIAGDGAGNIYYTVPSSATLFEIPQGATATPPTLPATAGVSIATAIGAAPSKVLVDSAPSIWATSGTTSINRTVCTTPNTATGCSSSSTTTSGPTYGLAATAIYNISGGTRNSIFVSMDGSSNSLTLYQGSPVAGTYTQITGWPITGLSTPAAVASDGAQNVWTVNNLAGANSVFEIGVGKQALSPAAGFQKSAAYLGSARSLAIDSSGNVWIGLDGANSVTQIVGAAVPVVQPFAAALHANPITFQTIP